MLEHCHFKNLSYTELRGRGGAAEAVALYKHFIAWLDSFFLTKFSTQLKDKHGENQAFL